MIPKRIVAIGTSSFFGYFDPENGGYIGRLKVWHEKQEKKNALFNLGISGAKLGETTNELLKRLVPEATVREPDLILLSGGANDIRRSGSRNGPHAVSPEQFAENFHEMIVKARSIAKDVIVVSAFPIKEKLDSSGNYFLPEDEELYANILKKICKEENVPYIDIYADWIQKDYAQWLGPDGVHANVAGYEVIFNQLKDFLLDYYKN